MTKEKRLDDAKKLFAKVQDNAWKEIKKIEQKKCVRGKQR